MARRPHQSNRLNRRTGPRVWRLTGRLPIAMLASMQSETKMRQSYQLRGKFSFAFLLRWLVVPLLLMAQIAIAVPPAAAPAADPLKHAEDLDNEARRRYQLGDYLAASNYFFEAYGLAKRPNSLFNAARSFEAAGKLEEALPLFELYLSVVRGDDAESKAGRADANAHIDRIHAALKAMDSKVPDAKIATKPADPIKPADPVKPTHPAQAPDKIEQTGPKLGNPPLEPPDPIKANATVAPAPMSNKELGSIVCLGAGGGLLVAAIVVGFGGNYADFAASRDAGARINGADGTTLYPNVTQRDADAAYSAHNSRRSWTTLLGVTGAIAVGGGVLLWWLDSKANTPSSNRAAGHSLRWSPSLAWTGDGAVVSVGGAF